MRTHVERVVTYYNTHAAETAVRLHDLPHEAILPQVDALLPAPPFRLLDVGAGTGRDAAWYAARGNVVTAVEPAATLRKIGMEFTAHESIRWLDDRLPDLDAVRSLNEQFDVVLLSAVWMFLPEAARAAALISIKAVLAPGGRLVMTVQTSSPARQELKFFTTPEQYQGLAEESGLKLVTCRDIPDSKGRAEWGWHLVVLEN